MDILELVHDDSQSREVRPFACEQVGCSKSFARRSDLVRHLRIHSGTRPFACEWRTCGKTFIQRSALTVHMRTHTGERPHQCESCERAFADSSSLARHRRVHTGRRPYRCEFAACSKAFCRKTTLIRHQKSNHFPTSLENAAGGATQARGSFNSEDEDGDSELSGSPNVTHRNPPQEPTFHMAEPVPGADVDIPHYPRYVAPAAQQSGDMAHWHTPASVKAHPVIQASTSGPYDPAVVGSPYGGNNMASPYITPQVLDGGVQAGAYGDVGARDLSYQQQQPQQHQQQPTLMHQPEHRPLRTEQRALPGRLPLSPDTESLNPTPTFHSPNSNYQHQLQPQPPHGTNGAHRGSPRIQLLQSHQQAHAQQGPYRAHSQAAATVGYNSRENTAQISDADIYLQDTSSSHGNLAYRAPPRFNSVDPTLGQQGSNGDPNQERTTQYGSNEVPRSVSQYDGMLQVPGPAPVNSEGGRPREGAERVMVHSGVQRSVSGQAYPMQNDKSLVGLGIEGVSMNARGHSVGPEDSASVKYQLEQRPSSTRPDSSNSRPLH